MVVLDHIQMGSANIYTSAHKMTQEMKIGHYDGGFMNGIGDMGDGVPLLGTTVGHKAFPLGGGVYIEVEGVIDPFAVAPGKEPWFAKKAVEFGTEVFGGFCLRVDTMGELEDIAKRLGGVVTSRPSQRTRPDGRIRPDGPGVRTFAAPFIAGQPYAWLLGKPDWYYWGDRLYTHPSGQPVINAPALANPQGLAWLEVGGTEEEMKKWLGQSPSDFGLRFNGKTPGLYAIGVKTDQGEVVLRRPSANQTSL